MSKQSTKQQGVAWVGSLFIICLAFSSVAYLKFVATRTYNAGRQVIIATEVLLVAYESTIAAQHDITAAHQELVAAHQEMVAAHQESVAAHQEMVAADQEMVAADQEVAAADQDLAAASLELATAALKYTKALAALGLPYGTFPRAGDPFSFQPCTNRTVLPELDDADPAGNWAKLFEPDPDYWSWGNATSAIPAAKAEPQLISACDKYTGRGIYLCGYIDVPLDYTNASDPRITRLAVTKFQVSGLACADGSSVSPQRPGRSTANSARAEDEQTATDDMPLPPLQPPGVKSARTIVIEPGGPGGSGTAMAWRAAEEVSDRLSGGRLDVLGWDPRGVNASRPAIACFPYDADRDRWTLLASLYREVALGSDCGGGAGAVGRGRNGTAAGRQGTGGGPGECGYISARRQLALADAMNSAVFSACREQHGDLPRFMSTAFVARDVDRIREALGDADGGLLSGYFVSYGTGIGQTYANLFPDKVGHLILDGTEYVRDHRLLGGFGWTALDNATDAWRDGFLGECIAAGAEKCPLLGGKALSRATRLDLGDMTQKPVATAGGKATEAGEGPVVTIGDLEQRMSQLLNSLIERPIPGYTERSGPSLITYSSMVGATYSAMYNPRSWPALAQMLAELEQGNATLASAFLERRLWEYDPGELPVYPPTVVPGFPPKIPVPASEELGSLVICADSYDAPQPPFDPSPSPDDDGLDWWLSLWANMTAQNWIAGNSRFLAVLPCRHFLANWPSGPAEVYRGDLNATLSHPVLLVAETYDPATPLRNGRKLLAEMGPRNARMVVHHGYGHSSARDRSACTDRIARRYILTGDLPGEMETDCFADEKPYLYATAERQGALWLDRRAGELTTPWDPVRSWREHVREMRAMHPGVL